MQPQPVLNKVCDAAQGWGGFVRKPEQEDGMEDRHNQKEKE